jgi:lysozyme
MSKITSISKNGIDLIKSFEGFRSNPYPDPATGSTPYTIGYGTTFYIKEGKYIKVTMKDASITEEQATEYLQFNLKTFEQYVDSYCRDDISQQQFDALTSFCYNVGPQNLKTSTLLKKVNANPNDITIRDEFMKWVKGNGRKLPGLVKRRKAEADLYFKL